MFVFKGEKKLVVIGVLFLCNAFVSSFAFFLFSYDSSGTSKDEIKERFAQTMDFVEEYLRDVVCQRFPFSDKEKNKLTFEVNNIFV